MCSAFHANKFELFSHSLQTDDPQRELRTWTVRLDTTGAHDEG